MAFIVLSCAVWHLLYCRARYGIYCTVGAFDTPTHRATIDLTGVAIHLIYTSVEFVNINDMIFILM